MYALVEEYEACTASRENFEVAMAVRWSQILKDGWKNSSIVERIEKREDQEG